MELKNKEIMRMNKRSEIFKMLNKKDKTAYENCIIKKMLKDHKEVKRDKLLLIFIAGVSLFLALTLKEEWRRTMFIIMLFLSSLTSLVY